jgi:hypothetical protein
LGVEGSAETFTVAHSVALGSAAVKPVGTAANAREPKSAPQRADGPANASARASTSGPQRPDVPTSTSGRARSEAWSTHTYLLWEPGFGSALENRTDGKFNWLGGGVSAGVRVNRYPGAPMDADLVAGAWASGGRVLSPRGSGSCGSDDARPFAGLVIGVRGYEVYASPKIGFMYVPSFCFRIFKEGESF